MKASSNFMVSPCALKATLLKWANEAIFFESNMYEM